MFFLYIIFFLLLFFPLLNMLSLVPLGIIYSLYGEKQSLIVMFLGLIFLFVSEGLSFYFWITLFLLLGNIIFMFMITNKNNFIKSVFIAVFTVSLFFIIIEKKYIFNYDNNVTKKIQTYFFSENSIFYKTLRDSTKNEDMFYDVLEQLKREINYTVKTMSARFFLFFLYAIIIGYFGTRFFVRKMKKKQNIIFEKFDFININLNDNFIWIFIFGFAIFIFGKSENIFFIFGKNIYMIISAFYFIQGSAILKFLSDKKKMSVLIKSFILLPLLLLGYNFIVILGVSDVWFDFRKIKIKELKNTEVNN